MPVSTGESIFASLEPHLAGVSKPIQYVGGELNSVQKPWHEADVRWVLMYPDAYEVGLPNQGVQILYEILNEREGVLAERTYSVWPDMESVMREHGIPQFTVDGHRPVRDFDVFGLSFSTELGYTNMLNALDLAGIPLHTADRDRRRPDRAGRGPRGVQPRADRRLRRRGRARRRRGDRARDQRGRPGVEGRGVARVVATSCCGGLPPAVASTCPGSTTCRTTSRVPCSP